jgi:hypothetical protein
MPQGLVVHAASAARAEQDHRDFHALLQRLNLSGWVRSVEPARAPRDRNHYALERSSYPSHTPDFATLALHRALPASSGDAGEALTAEIVVALLASPRLIEFPSFDEFTSAVRMRRSIVENAGRTSMEFRTGAVDRPAEYWAHGESTGYTLKPDRGLVEALLMTTQPSRSGRMYGFSCYRATEYVILLAIAQEATLCNPVLLDALERQWRRRAIVSGRFHDVFLREIGTNEDPLPPLWYVPGDRVWFRNPDEASSDALGYEGSWVFYLGQGRFSDFWRPDQSCDLTTKCLEVFHWRNGTYRGADGELKVDEHEVDRLVAASRQDPEKTRAICERMMKLRDLQGVYAGGGCLDRTRECPRWVRPGSSDIALPDAA